MNESMFIMIPFGILFVFLLIFSWFLYRYRKGGRPPEREDLEIHTEKEGWVRVELSPKQMREFERTGVIQIPGFDVPLHRENRVD